MLQPILWNTHLLLLQNWLTKCIHKSIIPIFAQNLSSLICNPKRLTLHDHKLFSKSMLKTTLSYIEHLFASITSFSTDIASKIYLPSTKTPREKEMISWTFHKHWSAWLIIANQAEKEKSQEEQVGYGFWVPIEFVMFKILLEGLEAKCLALLRNRMDRDKERGREGRTRRKGFREARLFCNV